MNRRALLTGLASSAVAISGCTGLAKQSIGNTDSERDQATLAVESPLSKLDAEFRLELDRRATPDHPPRIAATFENTSEQERTYSFGADAPLSPMPSEGFRHRLQLRPPPHDGVYDEAECWRSSSNAWFQPLAIATLAPGETVSNELDVLAAPETDGDIYCLPSGAFSFEQSVGRGELDSDETTSDAVRFSVTI